MARRRTDGVERNLLIPSMKSALETVPRGPHAPEVVPAALRRFTLFTAAWAAFVIFAGAQVTSTGSGLAVPDWPLSYGRFFPPMVGGIFYEHGHRLVAGTFGLLTLIQAFWLHFRAATPALRRLGWTLLGTTIFQGLLGGLTVKLLLPKPVSVSHGLVAEIAFCIAVSTAFFVSSFYRALQSLERGDAPIGLTSALVGAVFLQVFAGAVMRHRGAGLAIPDFPLSFGRLIPAITSFDVAINFLHRLGALSVTVLVVVTLVSLRRFAASHPLRQLATILGFVVTLQIVLGAYTVWSGKQPIITSFHVMNGAITLALSVVIALTARTIGWRAARQRTGSLLASEVTA
jgi:cytochrome c oxidase assembly protein subunit 15